eukprot:gene23591-34960_t
MSHSYVATAHKPTAAGLIVAFGTRIEIWRPAPDGGGLQRVCEQQLRGRVTVLKLFRPHAAAAAATTELLFILFERLQYCVLRWDPTAERVATVDAGELRDQISSRVESGDIGLISPCGRLAAFHLYQGLVKVVPISPDGQLQRAQNLRLEEMNVNDICFLSPRTAQQSGPQSCPLDLPAVSVLSEDGKGRRHRHRHGERERELTEGSFAQNNVEQGARARRQRERVKAAAATAKSAADAAEAARKGIELAELDRRRDRDAGTGVRFPEKADAAALAERRRTHAERKRLDDQRHNPGGRQNRGWSCKRCTLENAPERAVCAACGTPREAPAAAAAAATKAADLRARADAAEAARVAAEEEASAGHGHLKEEKKRKRDYRRRLAAAAEDATRRVAAERARADAETLRLRIRLAEAETEKAKAQQQAAQPRGAGP